MKKKCKHCKRIFETPFKQRRYCSDRCKEKEREKRMPTHICDCCGETFKREHSKIKSEKKYCSRECKEEMQWKERPKHICDYCGDTFRRASIRIRTEKVYCSVDCRNKAISKLRENRKGMKYGKAEVIEKSCKCCKGIFTQKRYKGTKEKDFCSLSCSTKYRHIEKEKLGAKNLKQAKKMKEGAYEKDSNI